MTMICVHCGGSELEDEPAWDTKGAKAHLVYIAGKRCAHCKSLAFVPEYRDDRLKRRDRASTIAQAQAALLRTYATTFRRLAEYESQLYPEEWREMIALEREAFPHFVRIAPARQPIPDAEVAALAALLGDSPTTLVRSEPEPAELCSSGRCDPTTCACHCHNRLCSECMLVRGDLIKHGIVDEKSEVFTRVLIHRLIEGVATPEGYVCARCKAAGVKLWRKTDLALAAKEVQLTCAKCVGDLTGEDIDLETSEQGQGYVPAIPTEIGQKYWSYASAPEEGAAWWKRLPVAKETEKGSAER